MKRHWPILISIALLNACATPVPVRQSIPKPPPPAVTANTLDARLEKADLAFREARLTDAERLYRSIAETHPTLTEVWVRLGNIYTRQDELDAAIRAYEMALRNDRYEGRAWYNLAVVHLKQSIATLEQAGAALPEDSPYRRLIDAQHAALLGRAEAGPTLRTADAAAAQTTSRQRPSANCWNDQATCE